MPPQKTVAAAVTTSKAGFIKVPRIGTSYRQFLKYLLEEKQNRKLFMQSKKDAVDQCYRLQATQQFNRDYHSLKRAMSEPDCPKSIHAWKNEMATMQKRFPKVAFAAKTAEDLEDLSLPVRAVLAPRPGTEHRDFWKGLTYKDFAEQLQRKNSDAVLTKHSVDSAFRSVVDRVNNNFKGRESAIARILGEESTKYWKDK